MNIDKIDPKDLNKLKELMELLVIKFKKDFINMKYLKNTILRKLKNDKIFQEKLLLINKNHKNIINNIDKKYRNKIKIIRKKLHTFILENNITELDSTKLLYTTHYEFMNYEKKKIYDIEKKKIKELKIDWLNKYLDSIINSFTNNISVLKKINISSLLNFHINYFQTNKKIYKSINNYLVYIKNIWNIDSTNDYFKLIINEMSNDNTFTSLEI